MGDSSPMHDLNNILQLGVLVGITYLGYKMYKGITGGDEGNAGFIAQFFNAKPPEPGSTQDIILNNAFANPTDAGALAALGTVAIGAAATAGGVTAMGAGAAGAAASSTLVGALVVADAILAGLWIKFSVEAFAFANEVRRQYYLQHFDDMGSRLRQDFRVQVEVWKNNYNQAGVGPDWFATHVVEYSKRVADRAKAIMDVESELNAMNAWPGNAYCSSIPEDFASKVNCAGIGTPLFGREMLALDNSDAVVDEYCKNVRAWIADEKASTHWYSTSPHDSTFNEDLGKYADRKFKEWKDAAIASVIASGEDVLDPLTPYHAEKEAKLHS